MANRISEAHNFHRSVTSDRHQLLRKLQKSVLQVLTLIQMRALRNCCKIPQLPALAHVAATPRHLYQGPACTADADEIRPGAGQPVSLPKRTKRRRDSRLIYTVIFMKPFLRTPIFKCFNQAFFLKRYHLSLLSSSRTERNPPKLLKSG